MPGGTVVGRHLDGADLPPPTSLAVPLIVTAVPLPTIASSSGAVMAAVGGVVSVDADARTSPSCSVAGCASMSASRLTVACCMRASVGVPGGRRASSSPHVPLDGAGAEHERAAGLAVEGQMVRGRTRAHSVEP